MENLIAFFEIPSTDFHRAVKFYETILHLTLPVYECETEKIACFPRENGNASGAIFHAPGYKPCADGVIISLQVDDVNATLALVEANGGRTIRPKTKIEAEGRGYFALFSDSEGNKLGLYADK